MTPPEHAVPEVIVCVECGEDCHLLTPMPEDVDIAPGTSFPYRCSTCMERFDVVWEPGD